MGQNKKIEILSVKNYFESLLIVVRWGAELVSRVLNSTASTKMIIKISAACPTKTTEINRHKTKVPRHKSQQYADVVFTEWRNISQKIIYERAIYSHRHIYMSNYAAKLC